ncbi:energy transducer TonB [Flavisphingomonas formosensis]|uniref:energy transducer TonB n=1 Tax=Flavisphingomonas formosensis TaxID=861534 RepID=UPI0012FC61C0|nr:energy transducer TonB [Sphingomonas formosensis]
MNAAFQALRIEEGAEIVADRDIAAALAAPVAPVRYGEGRGPNWATIGAIVAGHVLLLFLLIKFDVVSIHKPKNPPLVVELLQDKPPPPPSAAKPEPAKPTPVAIVVPQPIVPVVAPAPPPVTVTDTPPPPRAVIVAPAAPPQPAVPAGPVDAGDLASKMIAGDPPRYPIESRRKHEQGTVWLTVLVGLDGRVSDISVARSSGSSRLDEAALAAVKRWRWSPTMRNGAPVMVRGTVDIPFVLQSA